MAYYKLLFLYLIILCIFSVDYAFRTEELVGGFKAFPENYKFQVAIIGKYNVVHGLHLICSAGILSNYLLISSARCFIGRDSALKQQTFFAAVGQAILNSEALILKIIEKIYTYNFFSIASYNDISIAKLAQSLELEENSKLASLKIPAPDVNIYNNSLLVAGYGVSVLTDPNLVSTRERVRIKNGEEYPLHYAYVTILTPEECKRQHRSFLNLTSICGLMEPNAFFTHRGICVGDLGSPLQFDDILIGIVSKRNKNCDDTSSGSIYTKVSYFNEFVNSVEAGTPIPGTTVHYNLERKEETIE